MVKNSLKLGGRIANESKRTNVLEATVRWYDDKENEFAELRVKFDIKT